MCCTCSQHFIPLLNLFQQHFIFHLSSFFVEDFKLYQDLELCFDYFKLTLHCMPHLSINDLFDTKFKNFVLIIQKIMQMIFHNFFDFIHIFHNVLINVVLCMFLEPLFLNHGKPFGGVCLIVIGHFIFKVFFSTSTF